MGDAIESETLKHDGFDIRIDVVRDTDSNPFDPDSYDESDIESWRNDEWFYVGYVYTASREGVELGESSIWGSEWDFPGSESSIAAWIREDYYHPDLVRECIADARATLARLQDGGMTDLS